VRRIFQAIDEFGRVVAAAIPARVVGGARISMRRVRVGKRAESHRPGAGVPELPREFWNRQLCQFAAQFVKPLSAFCVCTGFVWDL
jgi:hypothetical protein